MRKFTITALSCMLLIAAGSVNAQMITVTMAGSGSTPYNGNGQAGYLTQINNPTDVCMDAAHNIYFADNYNGRIRKMSAANGVITTVAGGGSSAADGIAATSASLSPGYMCIDASGNLYVSTGNKIREINAATGIITTIAGTGAAGYSGDGGLATSAMINGPMGICIDAAGNIYIVDQSNNRIRKVTAATGIITTIAGTSAAGYSGDGGMATAATLNAPTAICVNAAGDIYFADQAGSLGLFGLSGECIRKISASSGIITTIAGSPSGGFASGSGGPALSASVGWVYGLCCNDSGDLFICDVSCSCRKITMSTGIINTIAGSDVTDGYAGDGVNALSALFNWPHGLCLDPNGDVFIADTYNSRIRKSIQLTHTPAFAYGKGQTVYPCSGSSLLLDAQLSITDVDVSQTETWTVLSAPANGTLSGFPYSRLSTGVSSLTNPAGLSYTSAAGYVGTDSFRVVASDGLLSDTTTIYVTVSSSSLITISHMIGVCVGDSINYSATYATGLWSAANGDAIVGTPVVGSARGVTPGVDTILYSIPGVCNATDVITVHPTPNAGTISGSGIVCVGSAITVSDAAPGGTWSLSAPYATIGSGSGTVTGVSSGTAVIAYMVSNAFCSSVATSPLTIGIPTGSIYGGSLVCPGAELDMEDDTPGGTWSVTNGNATFTVTGPIAAVIGALPGEDTLFYNVSNICGTASISQPITIFPAPSAGTISGPADVCMGAAVTYTTTVSGGSWGTYYYYAEVDSSDTYTATLLGNTIGTDSVYYQVTDVNGCTATAIQYINVDAVPDPGTISGTDNVYAGGSTTLANTVTGGTWSSSNTAISTVSGAALVLGVAPGTDSILYTVSSLGCSSTAYFAFTVLADTSTSASNIIGGNNNITIMPNPAKEHFIINFTSSTNEPVTITITNMAGEQIKEMAGTTNQPIDASLDVAPGIYLLNATTTREKRSGKIVIE